MTATILRPSPHALGDCDEGDESLPQENVSLADATPLQYVPHPSCAPSDGSTWQLEAARKIDLDKLRRFMIVYIYRFLKSRMTLRDEPQIDTWLDRLPEVAAFLESRLISVAKCLDEYRDHTTICARLQDASRRLILIRDESRRKKNNGGRRHPILTLLEQIGSRRCTALRFQGARTRARFAVETTSALLTKLSHLDKFLQRHIVEFL